MKIINRSSSKSGVRACLYFKRTTLYAVAALLVIGLADITRPETRGYAISDFHTATYSDKSNCPHGGNGASVDIDRRILGRQGYTKAQVERILINGKNDAGKSKFELLKRRGRNHAIIDPFNDPANAVDPKIELVSGHYGPGFNLDSNIRTGFEDPDAHEKGVDNQLFRVVGCFQQYNVTLPVHPFYEQVMWDTMFDTMPAWVLSITGNDLTADGPVTVTFSRAMQHLRRNTSGGALANVTFSMEDRSRSYSVVQGQIRDGVLYIQQGTLHLEGEAPILTTLELRQFHARLKLETDGSLSGIIGGYQPWMDFFYMASSAGEVNIGLDVPGIYYALKRLADAYPDATTGENTAISAAYRIRAVPAFLSTTYGSLVAGAGEFAKSITPVRDPVRAKR